MEHQFDNISQIISENIIKSDWKLNIVNKD